MGYRHYFYKVKKSEVEKVRDMEYDTLFNLAKERGVDCWDNDDEGRGFYFNDDAFLNKKEVFEFGKLYWDDTADRIYSKGEPLFSRDEVQDCFNDYVPYVVGKEGLLEAIEIYRAKVLSYYQSLIEENGEAEKQHAELVNHVRDKIFQWKYQGTVNTNEDQVSITGSWEYEHSIFNLAHLLKTIDWEKDTLLFYG